MIKKINSHFKAEKSFVFQLLALLMITAWGLSFISTKELLNNGLNPSQIYICRFLIAYLCLLTVTFKKILCHSWRDELLFLICGLCGGSLYFITENTAIKHTLVPNVALIVSTAPILTAILMRLLYKNERFNNALIIGSIVAFGGVGCVIFNTSFQLSLSPIGDFLSILAALSWSMYSVILRKLNGKYSTLFITRKVFFYGILTCIPFLFVLHSDISIDIFLQPIVWGNILFLGLGASMVAYLIWNHIVKIVGAVRASNYLYLGPLITLIASAIFLDERISAIGYIGCILIIGGVMMSEKLKI